MFAIVPIWADIDMKEKHRAATSENAVFCNWVTSFVRYSDTRIRGLKGDILFANFCMGQTSSPVHGSVTEVLSRVGSGEADVWDALLPLVYRDLRALAGAYMREHGPGGILQPTALVNETYLRMLGQKTVEWKNRAHFFGVAALVMRRILVDEARRRRTRTRIEASIITSVAEQTAQAPAFDLCLLDTALTRLGDQDPRQASVVELRYFGGLTIDETAEFLGVSPKTVKRDWEMARVWLRAEIRGRAA
jgi:RNA polymerase sigma-70 factor, ECF subfamily